jgi:hypothetical protein
MADLSKEGLRAAAERKSRGQRIDGDTQAALDRATGQSGSEAGKLNRLLGGGTLKKGE